MSALFAGWLAQALMTGWLLRRCINNSWVWLWCIIVVQLPMAGLPIYAHLRGLWGDPSATSIVLLLLCFLFRAPRTFSEGWRGPLFISLLGIVLYPLALGLGDVDAYRFGFQPTLLVTLLTIPALILWWRGDNLWLWLLAIDLLVFTSKVQESRNLWDALLDPMLVITCMVLTVRNGWRAYLASKLEGHAETLTSEPFQAGPIHTMQASGSGNVIDSTAQVIDEK
jgi:hypothetical protein